MNLENWQRRELLGATNSEAVVNRYYAYSTISNPADTDAVYSIRKVTVSGTVETSAWSDNAQASFNAKWSERAANFTAPTGALGFTFSAGDIASFSWTRLSGVNTYNIVVTNHEGKIVTRTGDLLQNSPMTVTETYINETNHSQYFRLTGTYSIVLQAVNAAGTLTATHYYVKS